YKTIVNSKNPKENAVEIQGERLSIKELNDFALKVMHPKSSSPMTKDEEDLLSKITEIFMTHGIDPKPFPAIEEEIKKLPSTSLTRSQALKILKGQPIKKTSPSSTGKGLIKRIGKVHFEKWARHVSR
ncbi:MAG: hypothetical protein H7836_17975, partial [Magnetococcus sp. YQC-3]